MTYLRPDGFFQKIFRKQGQCQRLTIEEQYDFGVRYFDLRIRFRPDGTSYFAHGFLEFFDVDPYSILNDLDKRGECVVNLVMESNSRIAKTQDHFFVAFCGKCEQDFPRIVFTGGWSKYPQSGEIVYVFNSKPIQKKEVYKVFTGINSVLADAKKMLNRLVADHCIDKKELKDLLKRGIDGLAELFRGPVWYARRGNAGYWKEVNDELFTVMDFIEIGVPENFAKKESRE